MRTRAVRVARSEAEDQCSLSRMKGDVRRRAGATSTFARGNSIQIRFGDIDRTQTT